MTADPESGGQSLRPARWRFFVQFSLRTLLLVTTIVAIGCWWFLRPQVLDEPLAGKFLQLRRQVRVVQQSPREYGQSSPDFVDHVNVGRWQLRDDAGNLLVAGRYARDLPEGWWTTCHANGRKAAHGRVFHGAKVGLWRTWNDSGTLMSEVHYVSAPLPPVPIRPGQPSILPNPQPMPAFNRTHESLRHGPARGWYMSGQLRFEGEYKDDRRSGAWTFYDEEGRVTDKRDFK